MCLCNDCNGCLIIIWFLDSKNLGFVYKIKINEKLEKKN